MEKPRIPIEVIWHVGITVIAVAGAYFYLQFQVAHLTDLAAERQQKLERVEDKLSDVDKNLAVLNRLLIENGTIKPYTASQRKWPPVQVYREPFVELVRD